MNLEEVKILSTLIDHHLNQDFLRELFKIEEINWFLKFVSNKKINRLIEWINDTYIQQELQEIAYQINEDHSLQYNLDHSDYSYFGYIQWLLKHKTIEHINEIIDSETDLSDEYGYQHYMVADDIIDLLRNSEIHEFNETDDESLSEILKNMKIK